MPDHAALLATLHDRFQRNLRRHPTLDWDDVRTRLAAHPGALRSLQAMEDSGGEPDAVWWDDAHERIAFCDCAPESPAGRRSLCYDSAALAERKENKPAGSALDLAARMGVALLDAAQYDALQQRYTLDLKTSSWLRTPDDMRAKGGALFGDCRYGRVFTYHNGAQSYYAARGFRAIVWV